MVTYSQISEFTHVSQLPNISKVRKMKKYLRSFYTFVTVSQQIIHVHAMGSLRHSCSLQVSFDRERL